MVNDGLPAADHMEDTDYALALLDIMLPQVDGYDLLDYALSLALSVIFITAKGTVGDRVKGLRLGADDYVVKPFEPEELVARVQSVLRRVGATLEREALYRTVWGQEADVDSRTLDLHINRIRVSSTPNFRTLTPVAYTGMT